MGRGSVSSMGRFKRIPNPGIEIMCDRTPRLGLPGLDGYGLPEEDRPMGMTISAARPKDGGEKLTGERLTELGENAETVERVDQDGYNYVVRSGGKLYLAQVEPDS